MDVNTSNFLLKNIELIRRKEWKEFCNRMNVDDYFINYVGLWNYLKSKGLTPVEEGTIDIVPIYYFAYSDEDLSVDLAHITELRDSCFFGSDIKQIDLPNAKKLGRYSFNSCILLQTINVPLVKEILESCFAECESLRNINLSKITSIGSNAFANCNSLTSIDISKNTQTIGKHAFRNCINLEKVEIRNTVLFGTEGIFPGCYKLTTLIIDNNSPLKNRELFEKVFEYSSANYDDVEWV